MEYIAKATPPQSPDGFTFDLQRFDTEGNWSDYAAESFSTIDETAKTITITGAEELALLATDVNNDITYEGWTITLGADIDLGAHNWTPIGNSSNQFKGTFDGDGYTISGLTISGSSSYIGLFGYVGSGGTVQNVVLTDVNVTGQIYVGGLVGVNSGTVSNVTVSGSVGGRATIGGLVGINYGKVSGNTSVTTVSGSSNVGALVGNNNGSNSSVTDNKYYGTTAVGINSGTVEDNTQLYKVTVPTGVTVSGDACVTVDGTTYAVGSVTLTAATGYVISGDTSLTVTQDTTVTVTDVWGVGDGADGSADNPYIISTVEGLQYLADYVNAGNNCSGLTFKVTADIDLSSVENFTPIGNSSYSFKGTFDGDSHTISNLTISSSTIYNVGLFGNNEGTIKNFTLDTVNINTTEEYVGALAGYNEGTIENCTVIDGTIVSSERYVGGLVGLNRGTISDCTINGTFTGRHYVGGLAGYNDNGTVRDCKLSGTVTGTTYDPTVGALVAYNDHGTVIDNKYYSNEDELGYNYDGTVSNNTRCYTIDEPEGVTVTVQSGDSMTVNGKNYYSNGATVTITITDMSKVLESYHTFNSFVGATKVDDTTYTATINDADITIDGYPKIGNLGFDTTDNAYTISTAADLQALATYVNAGNDCSGWTFKVAADINLDGVDFTAIGTESNQFKGTFDGGGYTISNLTISGSSSYVGLFGYVGSGGTVQNVTLDNATVSGAEYVGGLVGYNNGTVSGNTVVSEVSGTSNYGIGGIVGYNESGTVSDNTFCSNYGAINNSDDSSNTRLYTFTAPDGVTADFTDGDDYKVTVNGTTYYKSGATFKLTVTDFPNGQYLKGATADDGNYTYTMSNTALEWADIPTIDGLEFDRSINGFKIASVADLQTLATYVNAGNDCSGLTFKLTANITLDTVAEGESNFTPIGTYDTTDWIPVPFSGTFDGDGYTISNLTINLPDNDCVGLFGYVGVGGTIQNVTLDNANVSGANYVGGLVGYNEGGTINDCTVDGTVSGNYLVGGLVGSNYYGMVSGNTSISTVSGGSYVGGLVGVNGGTVSGNKFYSNVGAINGTDNTNNTRYYSLTVPEGVEYTVTGGDTISDGETIYYASGTTATLTATDIPDGQYLKGTTLNDDGTYSYKMSNVAVEWAVPPTIDGMTFDMSIGAFKISTAEQLQALATYVNAGNDVSGWTFKLTDDIDLDGVSFAPIGNSSNQFNGMFDGGGHTISKLTINSGSFVGLFGIVGESGTVQNVALTDVNVTGQAYVGGLVGANSGTVSNVTVSGSVGGNYFVGGVVAYNGGTVSDNTSIATVSGSSGVGGLVGVNGGTVSGNYYYSSNDAFGENGGTSENNTKLYALTVPDGVIVTGDSVVTVDGKYYAAGSVTFTATDGYVLKSLSVDGTTLSGTTFTVESDTTISADVAEEIAFSNGGKSVEVNIAEGDFSDNSGVYSVTASQQNSTLTGNNNNNTVLIAGGGENILTGGGGNDTYKFESGGGIVTDFGIGATKDSTGATLSTPLGSDIIKLGGTVSGVYFDRDASTKKDATFTAIVTYDSTAVEGDDTQIIVLQNINKKPTKYSSDASKVVYQTNDVAAATLKIWDTSGSKQAVISASKLKALFRDDSDLSALSETVQTQLVKLNGIGELNLPAIDALNQTAQATFNGDDNG